MVHQAGLGSLLLPRTQVHFFLHHHHQRGQSALMQAQLTILVEMFTDQKHHQMLMRICLRPPTCLYLPLLLQDWTQLHHQYSLANPDMTSLLKQSNPLQSIFQMLLGKSNLLVPYHHLHQSMVKDSSSLSSTCKLQLVGVQEEHTTDWQLRPRTCLLIREMTA